MVLPGRTLTLGVGTIMLLLLVSLTGCAKSISPPGGPVDQKPPVLASATPVAGAVMVSPDTDIIIDFSENLDSRNSAKAIFIAPRLDPEPKIKIKGSRVIITPEKPLDSGKTYSIVVGTDARDAHGVALAQSISVAFSTGDHLDSGSLHGTVYNNGKPVSGISVGLFGRRPEEYGKTIDSLIPEYLTQTGAGGKFRFDYLPFQEFFLVACEDKNKNRRINPKREPVGLPFVPISIDAKKAQQTGIDISLRLSDSGVAALRGLTINADGLIKARWNRGFDATSAAMIIQSARIISTTDSTGTIPLRGFSNLAPYPCADFALWTDSLATGQEYSIVFDLVSAYPDLEDTARIVNASVIATEVTDKVRPVIVEHFPADKAAHVDPDSAIVFRFSEPIEAAQLAGAVMVADTTGRSISLTLASQDGFSWKWVPDTSLLFGKTYEMALDRRRVLDRHGNRLGDSVDTIRFSTIGKDTVGQISGELQVAVTADAAYPVVISYLPVGEGRGRTVALPPGQKRFAADLLPGYYLLTAFLDRNGNGTYDYGSPMPYQLAEPFCAPPDTIRVRTRFESAGIILKL